MPSDKRQLYEFDVRVPLMIRGPNVTAGQVVKVLLYCRFILNSTMTNPHVVNEAYVNFHFRGFKFGLIFLSWLIFFLSRMKGLCYVYMNVEKIIYYHFSKFFKLKITKRTWKEESFVHSDNALL